MSAPATPALSSPGPSGLTLVVAAWEPELARLRLILSEQPELRRHVLTTTVGVGLVEAAIGTTRALLQHRPARVILVGTCGVYATGEAGRRSASQGTSPRVGQATIVRRALLSTIGAVRALSYFPEPLPAVLEPVPGLGNAIQASAGVVDAVAACPLAITRDARAGRELARKAGAQVENLEAFAVGRAATLSGVPFAAVLGVSNTVGPGAHKQWMRFGEAAAAAACEAVAVWLARHEGVALLPIAAHSPVTVPSKPRSRAAAGRARPRAKTARRSPA